MTELGKVFISYAREDVEIARKIYLDLLKRGLKPWMDKPPHPYEYCGLLPGEYWKTRLTEEISSSQFLIALLSNVSVKKRGYVQREYRLALDTMNEIPAGELFLFPILVDDTEIPNLTVGNVSLHDLNWHYFYNDGLDAVVISMRRKLIESNDIIRQPLNISDRSPSKLSNIHPENENKLKNELIQWFTFVGKQRWKNNPIGTEKMIFVGSCGIAWNTNDELDGFMALKSKLEELVGRLAHYQTPMKSFTMMTFYSAAVMPVNYFV